MSIYGSTTLIGAPEDDDRGSSSGSAYIFRSVDGGATWSQAQKLTASDGYSGDSFGKSVSVYATIALIGASEDDARGSNSGSAYIFHSADEGATWSQAQKLAASDGYSGDSFGESVSIYAVLP